MRLEQVFSNTKDIHQYVHSGNGRGLYWSLGSASHSIGRFFYLWNDYFSRRSGKSVRTVWTDKASEEPVRVYVHRSDREVYQVSTEEDKSRLPERYQQILSLFYGERKKATEIAPLFNVSRPRIYAILREGIKRLNGFTRRRERG